MNQRLFTTRRHARPQAGFTLVELMIAMILGLVVIAGITSVFLAGQQSFRTNHALSDVQDSSRIAFELMARDIRQAGFTGCGSDRIANVLSNGPSGTPVWWADSTNPVLGYSGGTTDPAVTSGTAVANRVAATDSIALIGATNLPVGITADNPGSAQFTLSAAAANLTTGDVIVVCDPDHASVTQTTNVSGTTVNHAASGTPGNCTASLSYPVACGSSGSTYQYSNNATLATLDPVDWYVGNNPDGGTSLYRISLVNVSGVPTPTAQEMVRNVTNMAVTYLQGGNSSFLSASSLGSVTLGTPSLAWTNVTAVHVVLTVESNFQRATVDYKPVTRTFAFTTTLRNRVQ